MKTPFKRSRLMTAMLSAGLAMTGLALAPVSQAADHKDAVAVDFRPAGDITDAFAFVDPNNSNNVVLMMAVNPFLNPNENPSNHFATDYLYQIKIDNDQGNGATEDLVVQFEFGADPDRRTPQEYKIKMGTPAGNAGPDGNRRLPDSATICEGETYTGQADARQSFNDSVIRCGSGQAFAGVADDSFQTDVAQYVFRIGLNPDPDGNGPNHTQDLPRFPTGGLLEGFRGRELRTDEGGVVNSGVDGFGGFNTGTMAVSVPRSALRGSGIVDARDDEVNSSLVGVWGTVSLPDQRSFNGFSDSGAQDHSDTYNQFERMGQQLFNTVFGFRLPPLNPGEALSASPFGIGPIAGQQRPEKGPYPSGRRIKDLIDATGPGNDVANFSYLVFDSIVRSNTLLSVDFNTIEGRATLLTALGFTLPETGTPLIVPQLAEDTPLGQRKDAFRDLLLPDYMRLNLDVLPSNARNGAAAATNSDNVLSIGRWGLQNGRRPADDVTDILVRLAREVADVAFPENLTALGLDLVQFPGGQPLGDRRALRCEGLEVAGGGGGGLLGGLTGAVDNVLDLNGVVDLASICEDSRIFAVLQGTDWIEPTQLQVNNMANQDQLRNLRNNFPYVAEPHPVPGEPGTVGFPRQDENSLSTIGGEAGEGDGLLGLGLL